MSELEPLAAVSRALDRYVRKATLPRAVARHRLAVRRTMPAMARAWEAWQQEMTHRLSGLRTPSDIDRAAWATLEERGKALLSGAQEKAFTEGGRGLALRKARTDLIGRAAKQYVATVGAKRIVQILTETRQTVRSIITRGINWGWGPAKTGRYLRPVVGLTERQGLAVGNLYTRLLDEGVAEESAWARAERYANHLHRVRSETIARTESNNALRQGIIEAAREHNVEELDRVGDPQACEVCVELNAAGPYTPEEAADEDIANPHPNCECTFVIHTASEAAP